jgi:hypothetical protein
MITSVGMSPSLRTLEFVCGQFLPDYKSRRSTSVRRRSSLNRTVFDVQDPFNLERNLERSILSRKVWCGFSLGAQKTQILDGQHLFAKDHAKLTGCLKRDGFEGRKFGPLVFRLARNLKSKTCDRTVGDSAWIDQRKIAQISGDVERKAMRSDSARDVDAYCANLALSPGVILIHCRTTPVQRAGVRSTPNASEAADSPGGHAELSAQANEGLFHEAHEVNGSESAAARVLEAAQVKDGVANELTGTVIGDITTPVDLVERHASAGQKLIRCQNVAAVGIAAKSKHRRMLEQKQDVANAALKPQRCDLRLEPEAFVVADATEIKALDHP